MIDSHAFRKLMGCFATGITVITANDPDRGPVGITINSLTSVSLKPPLVLFCLEKKAHLYSTFKKAKNFAVNILGEDQESISRYFADHHHNPKPAAIWGKDRRNCPIVRGTLAWMVCEKTTSYKGGDHTILIGEVMELYKRTGQRDPLLYFQGRYNRIRS